MITKAQCQKYSGVQQRWEGSQVDQLSIDPDCGTPPFPIRKRRTADTLTIQKHPLVPTFVLFASINMAVLISKQFLVPPTGGNPTKNPVEI
jgi:hypothetical protein